MLARDLVLVKCHSLLGRDKNNPCYAVPVRGQTRPFVGLHFRLLEVSNLVVVPVMREHFDGYKS